MICRLRATIIGWYGTETIGDRAILAGIIRLLSELASDITLHLGSLFPVLSDRTLNDDSDFLEQCARKSSLKISIFDSKSWVQLEKSINSSDALIIGGGPLMDIEEMFMLEYAVLFAKRKRKRTIVLGCGYGPLKNKDTIQCANRILKTVDYSIMRDANAPFATIDNLVDPASFACLEYLRTHTVESTKDYFAVNLRDVVANGNQYPVGKNLEQIISTWFSSFIEQCYKPVYLVPMHTFSVGFDDRFYLERHARAVQSPIVKVISTPLSLRETMDVFYNAYLCVGMRFHAILFQTLLNGNNYILDYTLPDKGKTIALMRQLNMLEPYRDRYTSLFQDNVKIPLPNYEREVFHFDHELLSRHFSAYVDLLNKAFNS